MHIFTLKKYLELCDDDGLEPSISGLKAFDMRRELQHRINNYRGLRGQQSLDITDIPLSRILNGVKIEEITIDDYFNNTHQMVENII